MNMDQDQFKSEQEDREETSARVFNGLPADNEDADEEIIELTDVIQKGKGFKNSDAAFTFEPALEQPDNAPDTILGPDDDNLEAIIAGLENELEKGDTDTMDPDTGEPGPRPDEPLPLNSESEAEEQMKETEMLPEEASDANRIISDEQIERILTPMVREVIERTVRETVAEVAERVIKEAIDSLKESIEPPR